MKIGINALYSMSGKYGGMRVYLENLLNLLFEIDCENSYVLFCNAQNYKELNFKNHNVKKNFCPVANGLSVSKTLWEQILLPVQTLKHRIDILFSPAYISPAFLKCKSVVTIHCTKYIHHPEDFNPLALSILKVLIPLSARKCNKIITVSNCAKSEIIKAFNVSENKISVIPYAAGSYFHPSEKKDNYLSEQYGIKKKYILSVASTKPHKNLRALVEAYIRLRESGRIDHQLVLAGDKRPLMKDNWFSKSFSNWGKDIIFTGIIPNNQLPQFYTNADIFVFVSKYESFGIPIIEAMSCGTPVVTSSVFSMPEAAGGCALLADPSDSQDIANKIYELIKNQELRNNLIEKGKKHTKNFSWRKTAEQTLKVFKETCYNKGTI